MRFFREASLRIRLINGSKDGFVNTLTIEGLRVSFSILKYRGWTTNRGVIRIWNLSQENRNLLKNYGDQVTLYAGYRDEGGTEVIFIGNTTSVFHAYDQPEIVTTLECNSGDIYANNLRVSLSYSSETSARQIIRDIARDMGVPLVEFADSDDLVYRQGYKFIGMGKDALDIVCSKLNLEANFQDNALQVIPLKGAFQQQPIIVNENTGMQGIPQRFTNRGLELYRSVDEKFETGYKVNVALNPLIIPGNTIILTSTHLNFSGPYLVNNVRHEGDTYGFLWSSQLQVTELVQ